MPDQRATLFVDASYCPETRVGAWACWWKVDSIRRSGSGVFRVPMPDSTTAEACALARALHAYASHEAMPRRVLAQTDCLGAINVFRPAPPRMTALAIEARRLVAGLPLVIEYRHVRGHQGGASPRSWVNEWCDGVARQLMRRAREEARAGVTT